ncbi:MAG: PilZ domain-containing protein [Gammaproteobacteria bacterium]|uniref:PilZ domain-containing protein n=1 Tax=Pseudomaricurvus alcaniphilus TaxID=1166482 RepID=UPI00140B3E32|nr:PilZ domain-containing protein [Pseudomaricurvus alcaniphilus]MBR9910559.1 PilZ domain-containing protein [Gammaproteobacteria bacterium]NHN39642.1 PilZ domain-containing protein [Pseudomaricurvus alcaniphilus]
MANKRIAVRTPFKSRIRIDHNGQKLAETFTKDISDSGAYLYLNGDFYLDLGDVVTAQVMGLPGGDAPTLEMEVVRIDDEGVGLKFV